jgi:hypothetical protein
MHKKLFPDVRFLLTVLRMNIVVKVSGQGVKEARRNETFARYIVCDSERRGSARRLRHSRSYTIHDTCIILMYTLMVPTHSHKFFFFSFSQLYRAS